MENSYITENNKNFLKLITSKVTIKQNIIFENLFSVLKILNYLVWIECLISKI